MISSKGLTFIEAGYPVAAVNREEVGVFTGLTFLESMFVHCIRQVQVENWDIDFASERVGLAISSTKGNIDLLTDDTADRGPALLGEMAARIASATGFRSEPIVVSNACISGLSALMVASRLLEEGRYDHVMVAGGDVLSRFVMSGFIAFKSVSPRLCRPFDEARDGLTMGEACGAVLLSRRPRRGCRAMICGAASSNDANHISGPSRTGDGLYFAIEDAMGEAGISPEDLSFISAHGTATVYNDEMESKALSMAGMSDVPVNSLKPLFGHTLGACGVIESIMAVRQLLRREILPTQGFSTLGVPRLINVCSVLTNADPRKKYCLKIGSGFGGTNAAVVLRLYEGEAEGGGNAPVESAVVSGPAASRINFAESVQPDSSDIKSAASVCYDIDGSPEELDAFVKDKYKKFCRPDLKFYKMDRLCKAVYAAAGELLSDTVLIADTRRIAIVLCNEHSSADIDLRHAAMLRDGEPASPAVFVYTLPNICLAEICIPRGIKGETTFFIDRDGAFTRSYAESLLLSGRADQVITGTADVLRGRCKIKLDVLMLQQSDNKHNT